jgi:hypothetical protein
METRINPATNRMAAQIGLPDESESAPVGVIPNIKPMVEASILAAANTEAVNIKTAIRLYLNDHPSSSPVSTDKLWPGYISNTPKAVYLVDAKSIIFLKVYSSPEGWDNIVFSLSQQKWLEGVPDNDHIEDQDIP